MQEEGVSKTLTKSLLFYMYRAANSNYTIPTNSLHKLLHS